MVPLESVSWINETMSVHSNVKKVTTHTLHEMKNAGQKISMLTAYDFSMARIVDEAGIDVILVGDSASNVMAGHETTLPITLDQMIYHASSVVRAVKRSLVVAIKIMKETGGHAVKMEGGQEIIESIGRILTAGIPVMGHLGLTPQSIYKFGTYVVRAKEEEEAQRLIDDAKALEAVGCFAIVLEKIPAQLAAQVAKMVSIPIIGIGAGNGVDGQVLVVHDMLGINNEFNPRFLRKYNNLHEQMMNSFQAYIKDVQSGDFPNESEQY